MYLIGELRDPKIAQAIEKLLRQKNLRARVIAHEDHFVVVAEDEASIPQVDHIYRLSVGLPVRHEVRRMRFGRIPLVLICLSILVYVLDYYGVSKTLYSSLFISIQVDSLFSEILKGEVWRLWSPMFLHFNFFHIFFNLLIINDLGSALEDQEGVKPMIVLTLVYGLLTNVSQYLVVGPHFGGMSGVAIAYMGQVWMRGKFDPEVPYSLPKRDVVWMFGWLVLCMTGVIGAIANVAHAVGLTSGMIVGILLTLYFSRGKNSIRPSMVIIYSLLALGFSALSIWVDWLHQDKVFFFERFLSQVSQP